jgi:glutamate formiminotransferase/glutamate formiminotransferase/formiminotetrahydrofolate cyclodeaminase
MTVTLLGVPNVSEGRDAARIGTLADAFSRGADLLDTHTDPDHNRSVFTIAGTPGALAQALGAGATAAVEAIDMASHEGAHPCIGALDVCPLVWLRDEDRETARAEALAVAERIGGGLEIPVFLYGDLASSPERRERAFFRRGGLAELTARMRSGDLAPDQGPDAPHPTAGATLLTARPPLVAFNITLDTDDVGVARALADRLREDGGGLAGVRAIGLAAGGHAQVSTNVHDAGATPLARVAERVRDLAAEHGAKPSEGELVGLAPQAALEGFPDWLPLPGFDPSRHLIESRVDLEG